MISIEDNHLRWKGDLLVWHNLYHVARYVGGGWVTLYNPGRYMPPHGDPIRMVSEDAARAVIRAWCLGVAGFPCPEEGAPWNR